MKKFISLFMSAVMIFMTACSSSEPTVQNENSNEMLKISATLFPQFDFARAVAGDKAEFTLLLPSGMNSHSYEPSPADIIEINNSDLFIYTGEYFESWADDIVSDIDTDKTKVLDVSEGIELTCAEEHNHEHEEEHHHHEYDPHIWTSPVIAMEMVDNIADALCEKDFENSDYYRKNAENYKKQLAELDVEIKEVVQNSKRDTIYFGCEFAMHYFVEEYGINYVSAFDSCSGETEPSAKVMSEIISSMEENNVPVIYYKEISEPTVAKMISEETGAEMLMFHSCHNVTNEDFKNGTTYIDLMKQNIINLKAGLE